MLMPESRVIMCPNCQRELHLTLQSELRARTSGTAISCPACGYVALFQTEPAMSFLSLSSPRSSVTKGRPAAGTGSPHHS